MLCATRGGLGAGLGSRVELFEAIRRDARRQGLGIRPAVNEAAVGRKRGTFSGRAAVGAGLVVYTGKVPMTLS